eukprot:jgi/Mesen1/6946/ME000360S06209
MASALGSMHAVAGCSLSPTTSFQQSSASDRSAKSTVKLQRDGITLGSSSRLFSSRNKSYSSLSINLLGGQSGHRKKFLLTKASQEAPAMQSTANEPSPLLPDEDFNKEWSKKPRRIALFVEPSPFAYVCGYKNRFQNFIRYLREGGDEVLVITTHKGVPKEFYGAKVIPSWSFPCPWYATLPLSLALSPRIIKEVRDFKPDLVHCSSPGIMCFGALIIAKLLSLPLIFSYHTHVPVYIPKYTFAFLATPMWWVIQFLHRAADITLVTSHVLGKELYEHGCAAAEAIRVWRKGVDSEGFNPRFKSDEWRFKLSGGEPEKPLIVHVGRLGAEKNLDVLRKIMDKLPNTRLAFIGDGPFRPELERMFKGTPTVFTGMLTGDDLSSAYASGDVFITPSESETLGFVVLEAMASGVPVVAARAGGIPDIVSQDGVTGFLFAPGDVDDAVGKINRLIASPELRREMATAARADVENFDWRASTRSVRDDAYASAVRLFLKSKLPGQSWLPWWTKKRELKAA